MTMTRRDFVEGSLSGMALLLAEAESRADQWSANPGITVVGVDGRRVRGLGVCRKWIPYSELAVIREGLQNTSQGWMIHLRFC